MSRSSDKSSSGSARSSACVFALAMMNWFSAPAAATAVEGSPRAEEFLDGGEHVHQVADDVPVSAMEEMNFDGSCPHEEQAAEALSLSTTEEAVEEGGPPIKAASSQRQFSAGFLQKRRDADGVQPELQPAAAFQFLQYVVSMGGGLVGGGDQGEAASHEDGHGGRKEQATTSAPAQSESKPEPARAAAGGFLQSGPGQEKKEKAGENIMTNEIWAKGEGKIGGTRNEVGFTWGERGQEVLLQLREEATEKWEDIKILGVEQITVPARDVRTSKEYPVQKGTVMRWSFRVKEFDVGFGVRVRIMQDGRSREEDVLAVKRYDNGYTIEGSWVADEDRTMVLVFDNMYSRLRSKTVAYLVGTEKAPEDSADNTKEKIKDVRERASVKTNEIWAKGKGEIAATRNEVGLMWGERGQKVLHQLGEEAKKKWKDIEILGAEEIMVRRRSEETREYSVEKGTVMRWSFRVKDFDVGFGVRVRIQDGGSREEDVLRYTAYNGYTIEGSWVADEDRTMVLVFDNRYSKLRSKTVALVVGIEKAPGEDSADKPTAEGHAAHRPWWWAVIQGVLGRVEYSHRKESVTDWVADLLQGHLGPFMFELHVSEVPSENIQEEICNMRSRPAGKELLEAGKKFLGWQWWSCFQFASYFRKWFSLNPKPKAPTRLMKVSVNLDVGKLDGSGRSDPVEKITNAARRLGPWANLVSLYFVEFPCGVWLGSNTRFVESRVLPNCASDQADSEDEPKKQKLDFVMSARCNCNLATADEIERTESAAEFTKGLSWGTFGLRLLLNLNTRPRTTDLVLRFGRTREANTLLFEVVRAKAGAHAGYTSEPPSVKEVQDEDQDKDQVLQDAGVAKKLQYLAPKRGESSGIAHIQFQILETLRALRVSPILLSGHGENDWRLEMKSRTTVSLEEAPGKQERFEAKPGKEEAEAGTISVLGNALKALDPNGNLPRGFRSTVAISSATSRKECGTETLTNFFFKERNIIATIMLCRKRQRGRAR